MKHRLTAKEAGYMELAGAEKDADCRKVEVEDGVSRKLGCCNEFQPESKDVQQFRCGKCEYLILLMPQGDRNALRSRLQIA